MIDKLKPDVLVAESKSHVQKYKNVNRNTRNNLTKPKEQGISLIRLATHMVHRPDADNEFLMCWCLLE